jgi:hypothetical protein
MSTTLMNLVKRIVRRTTRRAAPAAKPSFRPAVEGLEDRRVLNYPPLTSPVPALGGLAPAAVQNLLAQQQQAIVARYNSPQSPTLSLNQVFEQKNFGANYVDTLRNPALSDFARSLQTTLGAASQGQQFFGTLGQALRTQGAGVLGNLGGVVNQTNLNTMINGGMGHVALMTSNQAYQAVRNDPLVNAVITANPESKYFGGPAPAIQDRVNSVINAMPNTHGSNIDLVNTARLAGLDGSPVLGGSHNLVPMMQTITSPGAAFVQQGGPNVSVGYTSGLASLVGRTNLGGLGFTNIFGNVPASRSSYPAPQQYPPVRPFSTGVSYVPSAPHSPFGMYYGV